MWRTMVWGAPNSTVAVDSNGKLLESPGRQGQVTRESRVGGGALAMRLRGALEQITDVGRGVVALQ